jgi:hypothetical protein
MLRTYHEWIRKLAAESAVIAEMHLETDLPDADLETDAFNLANCNAHCQLITRVIDELITHNFSSKESARDLLRNLIKRNTDGAFAEIAAYDWLTRCYVRIATQVAMTPSDVLATQGSTLDGKITLDGTYFDVKSFGSSGRLAERLKERLEEEIQDEQVLVEQSWDLSSDTFQAMIESASAIAAELRQKRMVKRGLLQIRLVPKQPVTVSIRQVDPYCLANEYALFPFKYAKQFTRNKPFILIFVVHPWFNANSMGIDFAGGDTIFTRSLARRAFMQFSNDSTPLDSICRGVSPDVTLADAARLLSAIFFVNVWPKEADPTITRPMPSWLYLNPRATHRLVRGSVSLFRANNRQGTYIDDFANDDY